jgi:hypothetical protein
MHRKYSLLVLIGLLGAALLASEVQAQNQGGPRGARRPATGMMGGGGGGGGGIRFGDSNLLILLQNDKVQKDLQLVDEQKTKLKEAYDVEMTAEQERFSSLQGLSGDEQRTKLRELEKQNKDKTQKKLGEILLPHQIERLKQINLQTEGPMALSNPDIIKALNITSEQQDKMKALRRDEYPSNMSMSMSSMANESSEESQARITQNNMSVSMRRMPNESREEFQARVTQIHKKMLITRLKERGDKLLDILTQDQRDQFEKMKGAKIDIDISTLIGPYGRGGPGGPGGGGN